MKIYFVRHGESEANKARVEQGAGGSLSELGFRQAEYVSKRFTGTRIELIVSSTFKRARQTSDILKKNLKVKILFSKLFVEKIHPKEIIGKPVSDPALRSIHEKIHNNFLKGRLNWQYSDEESFNSFKSRAQKALSYLEGRKEDKILVVTHGGFLRMLISVMIFGPELTYNEYFKILTTYKTSNTGVTLCEYTKKDKSQKGSWKIIAWNDHAHIGPQVKKLKFRSSNVENILTNKTTTTLRLFDDKNLQKGDELILTNSDTDREFGRAVVVDVVEKRLGLLERTDFPTHENLKSRDKLYQTYRSYYGDIVTLDTLVKIVRFELVK